MAHQDRIPKLLPKTDKGQMVQDAFRNLGGELLNPDEIGLESYFEMIEDSSVRTALQKIINSVIGRGWEIQGGTEEVNKFITDMYARMPMNRVFERMLSAFWVGYSVTEKVFGQDDEGLWHIFSYKTLPPDTITFDVAPNGRIKRVFQNSLFFGGGAPLAPSNQLFGADRIVVFNPKKLSIWTFDGGLSENFGNPYGVSVLKGAYTDWFSKQWIQKDFLRWLELMAGGLMVANSGDRDPAAFHRVVSDANSSALVTHREGQSIRFESPGSDGEAYMNAIAHHDRRMTEVLVAPSNTQEGPFSSSGMAGEQSSMVRLVRTLQLQQQMAEVFGVDIRQISDINFGHQEEYPGFQFKVATEADLEARMKFILNGVKAQVFGSNDIPFMRRFVEWANADMDRGDPLVEAPSTLKPPSPGSSGSAGDGVMRDQTTVDRDIDDKENIEE